MTAMSNRTGVFSLAALLSLGFLYFAVQSSSLQGRLSAEHLSGEAVAPKVDLPAKSHLPGKPRYIFVDLGANRADSLEVFLKHEGAKFQYDYPKPTWANYEDASIYLFEANPVFNKPLVDAKQKYDELGIHVEIFPSTVADVKDGVRTFFLDTVNDAHDFWGSSIYSTHQDVVRSQSKGTDLTGVNIARWLLLNTLPRDFVVVKMDVEGAEYELVPHLAEMGAWSVVDHLLVEWHGAGVGGGTPEEIQLREERGKAAASKLAAEGVIMPGYDSGA